MKISKGLMLVAGLGICLFFISGNGFSAGSATKDMQKKKIESSMTANDPTMKKPMVEKMGTSMESDVPKPMKGGMEAPMKTDMEKPMMAEMEAPMETDMKKPMEKAKKIMK
jgi:hypothetical protein